MNLSERLAAARTARRAEAGLPPDPSPEDGVAAFFDDDDGIVIDLRDRRPPAPVIDGMSEDEFLASLRDPNAVLTYSWSPGPGDQDR